MNLKAIFQKIFNYLAIFFETQLIITLISLPILIHWGLSISMMSFIGNLIFVPFLSIFLTLSSLVFFTELINIPNNYLIYFLDISTNFWKKIMSIGQKNWLMGFGKVNIFILLLIPLITFFILSNKKFSKKTKFFMYIVLLLSFTAFLKFKTFYFSPNQIIVTNKLLIKKNKNNQIKIKDNGIFSEKQSVEKFVEFELRQEIIKNFGTLNIKKLTVTKPGIRTFKGIITTAKLFNLHEVKLPRFDGKLTKYGWKLFFDMKDLLIKNNIKLTRI
ncbi:hypothetical protein KJ644_02030 [Candidatus Dependentiae bacterium]|nr:hypothetical protein [Candidatus Dependentiae bacterium]MBU4387231.1 hypothetical protein [Candidatus Dependentiae bacterium]MCG2756143.1 hypothetical protein [Candidatus Dependentiae bacterium]